jgi:hypothetical protein
MLKMTLIDIDGKELTVWDGGGRVFVLAAGREMTFDRDDFLTLMDVLYNTREKEQTQILTGVVSML